MKSSETIFQKQDEHSCDIPLEKTIMCSIPQGYVCEQNMVLAMTHVEWRWRFFNINGRKTVEISKKYPNKQRLFSKKKTGEWIEFEEDCSWNEYIVKEYFYYSRT